MSDVRKRSEDSRKWRPNSYEEQAEALRAKIYPEPNSGCWLWDGAISNNGYGAAWFMGKQHVAHRAIYKLYGRALPDGLQLDHKCRNRGCVNPDHLEAVTSRENTLRGALVRNRGRSCRKCGGPKDGRARSASRAGARHQESTPPRRERPRGHHMGKRPDISIRLKNKDDGTSEYVLAGWSDSGKRGVSLKLSEGWRLIGPDNTEYTTGKGGNVYIDLFQNDNDGSKPDSRSQAHRGGRPSQGRGRGGSQDFPGGGGDYGSGNNGDEPPF